MAKITARTGGIVPRSGQYRPSGSSTEVTLVKGNRVQPNPGHRPTFTLVDATKHKS